jgi:hypothetical protein
VCVCYCGSDLPPAQRKFWVPNYYIGIYVVVFWYVKPCSLVVEYWRSFGTFCLHLQVGIWRQISLQCRISLENCLNVELLVCCGTSNGIEIRGEFKVWNGYDDTSVTYMMGLPCRKVYCVIWQKCSNIAKKCYVNVTVHRNTLNVLESCHQTCMTYTSAECTVENPWWWAEELPETCRVSWPK